MGQPKPPRQSPEERLSNTREVSLGFNKKISSEEARRCPQCAEPTCMPACPIGINIPGFIRFLREGDAASALDVIKKENPFPAICGRICPAPCETWCVFNDEGSPIAIRALERFASDFGKSKVGAGPRPAHNQAGLGPAPTVKKVAIVGSGPSAMMAASVLLKNGFGVVMLEAASQPGGILRYGIPEFRLPQDILNDQFDELITQGLELQTNVLVGRMKSLEELTRSFDAVLLATGASLPDFTNLLGENLAGVFYAEEFLMRLQGLSKSRVIDSARAIFRGSQTVVVGSGYAALDAARLAMRLGQQTTLVFGGLEEELNVPAGDLRDAIEEGLKVETPFEPLKVVGDVQGLASAVECRRLEILDEKEKVSLVVAEEAPTVFEAQTIILANSQKANPFLAKANQALQVNEQGYFIVDESTCQTSLEKIFATGSSVQGAMSVVEAFAAGKRVAGQIKEFLTS